MFVHRLLAHGLLGLALAASRAHAQTPAPVHEVLFTHIEDNTPGGTLGTAASRQQYLFLRSALVGMANLTHSRGVAWSLEPDWKFLQAALLYEDSTLRATTNGKNLLRFLKEDRATAIDPHSHENFGWNYTDVAHLLDSLGVGGSTVIGGHIWDPALPQFQEWDRFRAPVAGERFPATLWRGDILMGSGTPNHVNDPEHTGVWRPRDRDHYFEHDSTANIVVIGKFHGQLSDVPELFALRRDGVVPAEVMLTTSLHVLPATLTRPGGLIVVADSILAPLEAWRDSGMVTLTDFTSLVDTWRDAYGSRGGWYDPNATTDAGPAPTPAMLALSPVTPNPSRATASVRWTLARNSHVRLRVLDVSGRVVAVLVDGVRASGPHATTLDASALATGVYFARLEAGAAGRAGIAAVTRRFVVVR